MSNMEEKNTAQWDASTYKKLGYIFIGLAIAFTLLGLGLWLFTGSKLQFTWFAAVIPFITLGSIYTSGRYPAKQEKQSK